MILYYAITNYHILNCILHKLKYHKDKKAIIYLSKWHTDREELLKRLKKTKIFEEVLIFEEVVFPSLNKKINTEQIKKDIEIIERKVSKNLKYNISNFEEINICGDHYGISIYLNVNKINYNYFEDGSGILSNKELLLNNIKQIDNSRYQILKYLHLPGESKFIKNRYGDLLAQLPNYSNAKDVHFSIKEELKNIDKKKLQEIISIFCTNCKLLNLDNSSLILTFHYNNLNLMTLDEQRLFYGYLIDYFSNDLIVIKPHPSDLQGDYQKWFPQAHILPRKLPSEFLPFFVKNKFSSAITGWSTSVFGLKDVAEKIINFDQEIDVTFKKMNKYYVISMLLKEILNDNAFEILCYNLNKKQLERMLEFHKIKVGTIKFIDSLKIIKSNKKQLIIIDNTVEMEKEIVELFNNLSINEKLICLNSMNNFEINKNGIILEITKKIINNKLTIPTWYLEEEYLFYFTKNDDYRKQLKKFKLEKKLNYSNIQINVIASSPIIFENTYNKVIEENNELKIEIEKLKDKNKNLQKTIENRDLKISDLEKQIFDKNELINLLNQERSNILNSTSWKITKPYRKIGKIIKEIKNK